MADRNKRTHAFHPFSLYRFMAPLRIFWRRGSDPKYINPINSNRTPVTVRGGGKIKEPASTFMKQQT